MVPGSLLAWWLTRMWHSTLLESLYTWWVRDLGVGPLVGLVSLSRGRAESRQVPYGTHSPRLASRHLPSLRQVSAKSHKVSLCLLVEGYSQVSPSLAKTAAIWDAGWDPSQSRLRGLEAPSRHLFLLRQVMTQLATTLLHSNVFLHHIRVDDTCSP